MLSNRSVLPNAFRTQIEYAEFLIRQFCIRTLGRAIRC
ncbi:MAG: hypothetical protein RLZZ386_1603, partial [Planctomycetota bacterium]